MLATTESYRIDSRSRSSQPWIASAAFDLSFILLPPLLICLALIVQPRLFEEARHVPIWTWVIVVMGVDVGHVYSTLFRTYFDPVEFRKRRSLYVLTPILCWLGGVLFYSIGSELFWRILAYLAVFHFVRQQYGFMMLYSRKEKLIWRNERIIDKATIYAATIYPLIYWHTRLPRNFSWFMSGDFVSIPWPWFESLSYGVYVILIAFYLTKEVCRLFLFKSTNFPKHLLLLGTILSWYLGIITFNGDLTFTLTNVLTHGIPYIALVWVYERRNLLLATSRRPNFMQVLFQPKMALIFLGILIILGFVEEGLWDSLVWRERGSIFKVFYPLPSIHAKDVLVWLAPLLSVPQLTHYFVDAFIWKIRSPDTGLDRLLKSTSGDVGGTEKSPDSLRA